MHVFLSKTKKARFIRTCIYNNFVYSFIFILSSSNLQYFLLILEAKCNTAKPALIMPSINKLFRFAKLRTIAKLNKSTAKLYKTMYNTWYLLISQSKNLFFSSLCILLNTLKFGLYFFFTINAITFCSQEYNW